MSTLTVKFEGVTEEVLDELVKQGYVKTKSEALRYALLHIGEELDLIKTRFHVRAEEYAYREIKKRWRK
ncbi:MAG: hypothetical protein HY392_00485 [Candidatus Diapherotrites archaeon]|nr:hypothetical protein [Candidatus Diapherotrites archaeon]